MGVELLNITFVEILKYALYIILALFVLLIMITIHEFGHFIVGKKLGFKINEFAIGFGKVLLKHTTKDGILVTLRLVPLGGYCAFEGEDGQCEVKGAFNTMAPWKRLLVLFSGAFFNFLSAIIMSFILLISLGYSDVVQVDKIRGENANTNLVQLQEGDVILKVGDTKCNFVYDNYFVRLIDNYYPGQDVDLTIKRNGEEKQITIQRGYKLSSASLSDNVINYTINGTSYIKITYDDIIKVEDEKSNALTLSEKTIGEKKFFVFTFNEMSYIIDVSEKEVYTNYIGTELSNYKYSFFEALVHCVPFTCEWAWKVLIILWQLITGQLGIENLGGPITTISSIATYTQANILNLLILFPLISVNLAVFNWLPFPALDGARMVFVAIEWIRGKPINREVEAKIHSIGLIVLFAFVIFVDVFHFLF